MQNKYNHYILAFFCTTLLFFSCQSSPNNYENAKKERIVITERNYKCTLQDYFPWRGDLSFSDDPIGEIDYSILAQLSYNNYGGIVGEDFMFPKTISTVAKEFEGAKDFETRKYNGPLINENTTMLLKLAGLSDRFRDIKMCAFVDELDADKKMQFSAYTAILDDKTAVIVYRGTYTEIIGWEEDFNMTFKFPVPAQTRAVQYLENAARHLPQKLILIGHSKGGNLAMYAGAYCRQDIKNRITTICNLDGQGFPADAVKNKYFSSINDKLITFLPQSSVVGMLFHRNGKTSIVESNQTDFLYQHDMFSWEILGNKFIKADKRTDKSLKLETELNALLDGMEKEELEKFVKGVFGIFAVAEARTLQDFQKNWFVKSGPILAYIGTLDKQTKENMNKLISIVILP